MTLANMHIHSSYSWDSSMNLEIIAKTLYSNGFSYGAITDHVEFSMHSIDTVLGNLKVRNFQIDQINNFYGGKFRLLKAVEVSQPHLYLKEMKMLERLDLDFMMGSIHKMNRKARTSEELQQTYHQYYQDVLQMVRCGHIDVVGHLDYIKRYYGVDYSDFDQVSEVLEEIVSNHLLLEVNTSAARRVRMSTFPDSSKLSLYQQMGGSNVIIGSDAHRETELLDSIESVQGQVKLLKLEPGVFINRKFEKI